MILKNFKKIFFFFIFIIPIHYTTQAASPIENANNYDMHTERYNLSLSMLPERWAEILDNLSNLEPELSSIISPEKIKIQLNDKNINSINDLKKWLIERKKKLTSSQHVVNNLKIETNNDGSYTLDFEFIVEEKTIDGLIEISYLKEKWQVYITEKKTPIIIEIIETFLPQKQNSGGLIQC